MAPSSTHRVSISHMATRTEWDKKRNCIVKAKVIVAFLLSIATASQPAFTAVRRKLPNDDPPHVAMVGVSADNAHVLADLVATREQGEYVIGVPYQVAMMQFQLLGALHSMLTADIAWTRAVPAEPTPPAGGEVALVAMPFSSLQLTPSLVEYLGLNPTQARSIQRLMDRDRPKTEALMLKLRTVSAELGVAIRQNQNNDDKGVARSLAATQARLLKQLMTANLRLQRRIDDVLDPQQRKKLDALKHAGEVTVGEGS